MAGLGEGSDSYAVPIAPETYEEALAAQRDIINAEDLHIVAALNRRTAAAMEIGRIKARFDQPIHVASREAEVLDRASAANDSDIIPDPDIRGIFSGVIRVSCEAQVRIQEQG